MKGIRVFLDVKGVDPHDGGLIFYSQRAGGPYYRWRCEELRGEWRYSRMHADDSTLTALVSAPWNEIPATLKTTFDLHYVE